MKNTRTDKQRRDEAIAPHRIRLNAEKRALRTALDGHGVQEYRIAVTGYRTGGTPYNSASVPLSLLPKTVIASLRVAGFKVEELSQYATITPGQIA